MLPSKPIATQVLESLARNPACEFKQLVADCPEFTWNQLFYEIDWLSQLGQLCLTSVGGHYSISLPTSTGETMTPGQPQPFSRTSATDRPTPARLDGEPGPVAPVDRHVWIAQRAYQLYEAQGRRDGLALVHWLQAEGEFPLH